MSQEPYFICSDCGSDVLAVSHTWTEKRHFEEVGIVQHDGGYAFEPPKELGHEDEAHEWIAYCGGCGKGITVEWLSDKRVKLLLKQED